jgi:hypothetical protein
VFSNLNTTPIETVRSASGHDHVIQGQGTVNIPQPNGEINSIKDIKYVPGLSRNLLLIGQLTDTNKLVIFSKSRCLVVTEEEPHITVAVGQRDKRSGLYKFSSLSDNLEAHFLELSNELGDTTRESMIDSLIEEELNIVYSDSLVPAANLPKTLSP